MKIDFRREHQLISVVSFSLTFFLFLFFQQFIRASGLPLFVINYVLSLGFYLIVFRSLINIYNRWLWGYLGYRNIDIRGYWAYTLKKTESSFQRKGYAIIEQDIFGISINGINTGGGNSQQGISNWHTENAYILRRSLSYDYEYLGERVGSQSKLTKGRAVLEIISSKKNVIDKIMGPRPSHMTGNFYDFPLNSEIENPIGSALFTRIDPNELPEAIKNTFQV